MFLLQQLLSILFDDWNRIRQCYFLIQILVFGEVLAKSPVQQSAETKRFVALSNKATIKQETTGWNLEQWSSTLTKMSGLAKKVQDGPGGKKRVTPNALGFIQELRRQVVAMKGDWEVLARVEGRWEKLCNKYIG